MVTAMRVAGKDRGWIEFFSLLDTHFPPEKNWFLWDTIQNTEMSQAKVCGQIKIANVALSPSWAEATSTLMHPMVYTIAQPGSGINRNAFVQTFLFLLWRSGWSSSAQKANLSEKYCTHELFIVHWAGNGGNQDHNVLMSTPPAPVRPIQRQGCHPHAMGNASVAWFGPAPPIGHQGAWWQRWWQSDIDKETSTMTEMTATTAMAEMAMAMATAVAMVMVTMLPPTTTATMSMKMMAEIQGWQLDNGN